MVRYFDNAVIGYLNPEETKYEHRSPTHVIKFVVSGHLVVNEGGVNIHFRKGDYVFIRKNCTVELIKKAQGGEPYGAITLKLERGFLKDYFFKVKDTVMSGKPRRMRESFRKLEHTDGIDRIFEPLKKYLDPSEKPDSETVGRSMNEAVDYLLNIDESLYPTLFDFNEPWKIDIMAFMEEYYTRHMSLSEFANYTGRSLATFKRDFAKMNDVTP